MSDFDRCRCFPRSTRRKTLICFYAALALLAGTVLAQSVVTPTPQMVRVRADIAYLTSEKLGGRASLSPGAELAADYIGQNFREVGLRPANGDSFNQPFPLVAYRSNPVGKVLLVKRDGESRALAPGALIGGFYRNVNVSGPLVFAGYGITAPEYRYDDYASVEAKGKIVVVYEGEPDEDNASSMFNGTGNTLYAGRWMKVNNARKHGALAVLIAPNLPNGKPKQLAPARPPLRANAPLQSLDDPDQIPAFNISAATFEDLKKVAALRGTTVEIRNKNAEEHRGRSRNVAGLLEGSDPMLKRETVMLTAHYDHLGIQNGHLYPGANDNASGTTAVMELARLFAALPVKPKRSILFVVFGSEEQLMLGSFYYTAHPLRALTNTRAVINLDMIGRDEAHIAQDEGRLNVPTNTNNLINIVGGNYSHGLRADLKAANEAIGLTLDDKHDAEHTLNTLFRCDHLPFLIAHVPAVWLFGGFHPGYHEPSDTAELLNYSKIAKVIELAYGTAAKVADTPAKPPR